jgi:Putative Flp pilus-assembly TadE/G-like
VTAGMRLASGFPLRIRRRAPPRDAGQVSILIFGLLGVVLLLVLGGVDVTAAQIARARLLDASDSAALEAANALDEASAYSGGIGDSVVVSDGTVERAVEDNLGARPMPYGISGWRIAQGTGTRDGHTAVVVLQGTAELPMTGGLLAALGRSVTITVESRARAPLQ